MTGEVENVKVIRQRDTGAGAGYGFVEFRTQAAAVAVLQEFTGRLVPHTNKTFRLNWGSHGGGLTRGPTGGFGGAVAPGQTIIEHSIFVGDLSPEISDFTLQSFFQQHYPSCCGAKVG